MGVVMVLMLFVGILALAVDAYLHVPTAYAAARDLTQLSADAGQAQSLNALRYLVPAGGDLGERRHKHVARGAHAAIKIQRPHSPAPRWFIMLAR